jgi:hypothetical protein
MSAQHRALGRSLFEHRDHVVAKLVPRPHPAGVGDESCPAMAAQIDGRAVRLTTERGEDRLIGNGVESGGVEEHDLHGPDRVAESDPRDLSILQLHPKPAHNRSASKPDAAGGRQPVREKSCDSPAHQPT